MKEQTFKIINKQVLGNDIKRLDIDAPDIARNFSPGQFVMVCVEEGSRWIPLTIVESDTRRGMISVIFKEFGVSTRLLGSLPIHEKLFSVSGPFGTIREPKQVGVVICAATDVSAAQILPICRAYSRAGNKVIGILGAKTKTELILEAQMRIACHTVLLATEDGSYQRRGTVGDLVREVCTKEDVRLVYGAGDVDILRQISLFTLKQKIDNLIQVQTVMSCGRGMCGSCRVKANQKLVLACEEGPEFDGHKIDFDYLKHRIEHVCENDSSDKGAAEKAVGIFKKLFE